VTKQFPNRLFTVESLIKLQTINSLLQILASIFRQPQIWLTENINLASIQC